MEFNTRQYELSHCKQPRGTGQWAFATTPTAEPEHLFWHNGTYAEAKRAARLHFADKPNAGVIYVQP